MCASDSTFYVAWASGTSDGLDVYLARSSDGGQTFSDPIRASEPGGRASFPRVASAGSDIFLVSESNPSAAGDSIIFAKNSDGGRTFGCPINLSGSIKFSDATNSHGATIKATGTRCMSLG